MEASTDDTIVESEFTFDYPGTIPVRNMRTPTKEKSDRFLDIETGDRLSAAGILFYSADSFWAVEEIPSRKKTVEYNDIGGKYRSDDGHIHATIRRELYEETYGVFDLTVTEITRFVTTYGVKKVRGSKGEVVYVCVCVPISMICNACGVYEEDIPELFKTHREKVMKHNPDVPHNVLSIKKVAWGDINLHPISFRLKSILNQLRSKPSRDLPGVYSTARAALERMNVKERQGIETEEVAIGSVEVEVTKSRKKPHKVMAPEARVLQAWKDEFPTRKLNYVVSCNKNKHCVAYLELTNENGGKVTYSFSYDGVPFRGIQSWLKSEVSKVAMEAIGVPQTSS